MENIIIIRHGIKEYKNGNAPKGKPNHDPPLLKDSYKDIKKICKKINKPKIIFTSPFLRARETSGMISKYFSDILIVPDNNLTEFLGHQKPKGKIADVSSETRALICPLLGTENLNDIDERAKQVIKNIQNDSLLVTHGILIQYLYKNLTGENYGNVKELNGFIIKNNKIIKLFF